MSKFHRMTAGIILVVLATCCLVPAYAGTTSRAVLIRAMQDETQRSLKELRIGDLPKPYHIEYLLTERFHVGAHAILGTVADMDTTRSITLTVRVRIGEPRFDNTNFFDVSLGFFGSSDDEESFKNRLTPLSMSYDDLRRELWLATDACYKQAVEIYAKKTASLKNRTRTDTTWDFELLPPDQHTDTSLAHLSINVADVIRRVEAISAGFRAHPQVQASRVGMEFVPERTLYVNSEGRIVDKVEVFSGIEMVAIAQCDDGMPLADASACYSIDPADLPSNDSCLRIVNAMCTNLSQQMSLSDIEPYSGPVLVEGQAAAQLLAQEFAPNLVAQRKPLSEGGFSTDERMMAFQNKIGARVLPEFLSLQARPSLTSWNGTPVAGHLVIDDEGIPASDLTLVDRGYLRALLSSRIPTRRVRASNGHQRGGGAMISVLHMTSSDSSRVLSSTQLRERLLQLVKDRELPYGIIVRRILDRNLLGTGVYPLLAGSSMIRMQPGTLIVLEAVRLYADGHEEPLRGVELAGLSTYVFKDIVNVGTSEHVHNYLAPSVIPAFLTGGSQFAISTIITPDVLLDDAEVRQPEGDRPTVPRLPHPMSSRR